MNKQNVDWNKMSDNKLGSKRKSSYIGIENVHPTLKCRQITFEMVEGKTEQFVNNAGSALREAFVGNDYLSNIFEREGFEGVAKIFRERFTKVKKDFGVRIGDFGEVIAHFVLQDYFGYIIPVMKLRYKTNWKKAAFGIDIIAFRLDEKDFSKDGVIFSEVKTSQTSDTGINEVFQEISHLVEEGLPESNQKMRNAIRFISERLYSEKQLDLEKRLYRFIDCYTNPEYIEAFFPFLVREKKTWTETVLDGKTLNKPDPEKVVLAVFVIDDLEKTSEAVYAQAANWRPGD